MKWPWMLAGLLAISAAGNLVMVAIATRVPTFAVEENYYRKALDWDENRERNAELGWTIELDVDRDRLRVRLFDRAKNPISGASIRVVAFHNARASEKVETALSSDYTGSLPLRRAGLWEFRFEATLGNDRFTQTIRRRIR